LEASNVTVTETIPASRKLQRDDAVALLAKATSMTVAKGKKVTTFKGGKNASEEAIVAMLGSTGNLRAPTAVVGKTILVGFNEDAYNEVLG
jgi:arsenate reductase-like glutaredoxin family protein